MADSLNKLWLKGQAEEDIYIAKLEREQIKALKKKKLRNKLEDSANKTLDQDKQ
ncbi:MAG: hypothetical protein ABW096_10625 [Candidatus Thiodiazotropha sp.]